MGAIALIEPFEPSDWHAVNIRARADGLTWVEAYDSDPAIIPEICGRYCTNASPWEEFVSLVRTLDLFQHHLRAHT